MMIVGKQVRVCARWLCLVLTLGLLWTAAASGQDAEPLPAPEAPEVESLAMEPEGNAGDTDLAGEPRSLGAELVAKVRAAGWIGYLLLAMSVMGVGFAVERLVNLRRRHLTPAGLADRVLGELVAGRPGEAEAACRQQPSTLGRTLGTVVRHRDFGYTDLSTIAGDIGIREVRQHLQRAYPMAIVATLSPLLGLLGTVIGMIESFEAVALAGSMGDPSVMASSISFALITTAMGLIIAAPNLALYHIFRVRTNNFAAVLDEQVSEVLSAWHAHRTHHPQPAEPMPRLPTPSPEPSAPRDPAGPASPAVTAPKEESPDA